MNVFEIKDIHSLLCEIEVWITLQSNMNWIEFQFNQIQFNNCVKIKFHWKKERMQIGGEGIKTFSRIWCWKNNFKNTWIQKDTFPCFFTWEWAKCIPIWNCSIVDDLWNIKLSYLNQLQSIVVIKIRVYSNLHLRHDFLPKTNSHLFNN